MTIAGPHSRASANANAAIAQAKTKSLYGMLTNTERSYGSYAAYRRRPRSIVQPVKGRASIPQRCSRDSIFLLDDLTVRVRVCQRRPLISLYSRLLIDQRFPLALVGLS